MTQTVLFNCDGETAAQVAVQALERRGFRVVRSFDLRSALSTHTDCDCPHHGTDQCTCQFVVLLVYAQAGAPVVVTAHSRDSQAEVQVVRDANTHPDAQLAEQVMTVLYEAALSVQPAPGQSIAVPQVGKEIA